MKLRLQACIAAALVALLLLVSFHVVVRAATAPTLDSYAASTSFTSGTDRSTASVSWTDGANVLVGGVTEDNAILIQSTVIGGSPQLPTATGLTFAAVANSPTTTGSKTKAYWWNAIASGAGSSVITCHLSNSGSFGGIGVWVFSGSDGIGTAGMQQARPGSTTAPNVSLTRSGDNSFVLGSLGDWSAVNDTTVTGSPATNYQQRHAQNVGGAATLFLLQWGDQGAAGTTSYGVTGAGSSSNWTATAVEVLGSAGASVTPVLPFLGAGPGLLFLPRW